LILMTNGAFTRFKRSSGFGLIQPDGGGDNLSVHRAILDESVLATPAERLEFEWRDDGMGREARVIASGPNGKP
jgi:cold shock CspA family protein